MPTREKSASRSTSSVDPAFAARISEAMERVTGDIVITFSADGNCIPEVIPELIARMREGYDMVIASRYF
ncbi:MAG: glycosyltransferase, partial [Chloroflexi bacterium]|nr:glycosyltransferase [Chloroflexota bacterium]